MDARPLPVTGERVCVARWSPGAGWNGLLSQRDLPAPRAALLGVAFGAVDKPAAREALREAESSLSGGVLVGCSTAGEAAGAEITDESIVLSIVALERVRVRAVSAPLPGPRESEAVGRRIGEQLREVDLAHVFVLSDGLAVNGARLARGLEAALPDGVAASGGLAGDGDRFERTCVALGSRVLERHVVAVGFYGDLQVGVGVGGGWGSYGPWRRVTRAVDHVVFELDGEPALDLYERYLGDEARGLPATGLLFPMSVRVDPGGEEVVRTLLAVDREARSLTFAGDVPEGAEARLMKTNVDALVDAAGEAGRRAASALDGPADLALFVSCVGRRLVMGQCTEEENEAVEEQLGGATPFCGFYSYGELAPGSKVRDDCLLHNQTMTVTALREVRP